jgi:hypothetical protein
VNAIIPFRERNNERVSQGIIIVVGCDMITIAKKSVLYVMTYAVVGDILAGTYTSSLRGVRQGAEFETVDMK